MVLGISYTESFDVGQKVAWPRPDHSAILLLAARLEALGARRADVQARVDALSDEEVLQLAARLDSLPAGGDGFIGALVFVFLVLLITDIIGLTKVFPFTRPIK